MRTEEVLERLEGVKGAGQDRWLARCPGHPDRTPSLSVAVGDDGRTLLHCHARCPVDEITAGMNLTPADLFEKQNGNGHKEIANIYGYCDEKGELLYEVVRYYPKDFRQRKPDGHGGWTWKLGDTRRVLWKLPKVLEAAKAGERVAIAEGERDVEALEAKGLVATTNPGGAGKWRPEYTEALRGAQVGIFADKDEPGRRHAADVARSLEGIAASVKILEAPSARTSLSTSRMARSSPTSSTSPRPWCRSRRSRSRTRPAGGSASSTLRAWSRATRPRFLG